MTDDVLYFPNAKGENGKKFLGFIKRCKAPIFVKLTGDARGIYPKLADTWGILVPPKNDDKVYQVDYSWRHDWDYIKRMYPQISSARFPLNDISHYRKGDIPHNAGPSEEYKRFDPTKMNDVVVISPLWLENHHRMRDISEGQYRHYKHFLNAVGVVTRIEEEHSSLMVAFTQPNGETAIFLIKRALLIKMPQVFRQFTLNLEKSEKKQKTAIGASNRNVKTPKYKVGDVVRASSSCKEKHLLGLVGVIKEWEARDTQYNNKDIYYRVSFWTLPNISLNLSEGEDEEFEEEYELREWDVDSFNLEICSMPQLMVFEARKSRDMVWSCRHQDVVHAKTKTFPHQENGEVVFDVQYAHAATIRMPHYELDYAYDGQLLIEALGNMRWTTLGFEIHGGQEWAFLYAGRSYQPYKVDLRIKLGRVTGTPSIKKKLENSLLRLEHPWQVYRYLNRRSLGRFYDVITAEQYFAADVPNFEILDD